MKSFSFHLFKNISLNAVLFREARELKFFIAVKEQNRQSLSTLNQAAVSE